MKTPERIPEVRARINARRTLKMRERDHRSHSGIETLVDAYGETSIATIVTSPFQKL